jgi:D-3-phosphoglycerate dehydrogenase
LKLFVSTVPFAEIDQASKECLEQAGIEYSINPLGRKLSEKELASFIGDVEVLIAGTESITSFALEHAKKLKLIARVGIGLDSVDLLAAKRRGIAVTFTPDAPSPAVAELTISLMLNLLRSVHIANDKLHRGEWHRYLGRRLSQCVVGVIGMGRIGTRVVRHLSGFGCRRVMCNDLVQSANPNSGLSWEWQEKETIYREADIISIHVPLTLSTKDMISKSELEMMKPDAVLINTSRGGIVNEKALCEVMNKGHLSGVGIDTFEFEPYKGPLASIERCLLTAHMGSMSTDCRAQMELEAAQEAVRFFAGEELAKEVPEEEYVLRTLATK